jgi:glycolate oxidase iron-sulfur subunit
MTRDARVKCGSKQEVSHKLDDANDADTTETGAVVTQVPDASPAPPADPPVDLVAEIYQKTLDCIHCGLCLTSCPTYLATGRESASPRGRVYLLRGLAEGRIAPTPKLAEELQQCLGCLACESACPSGVSFGALLELAHASLERSGLRPSLGRQLERFALRRVIPRSQLLHALVNALGAAQQVGLDRLLRPLLPRPVSAAEALLPRIPPRRERRSLSEFTAAEGVHRGAVAIFDGCVMTELFGSANRATVRVLAANGFDVSVPHGQGCCGALQAHAGDLGFARELLSSCAEVFAGAGADALIVNSAGCGAFLRQAERYLSSGGEALAALVRDPCEFLDEVGLRPPPGRMAARVCYDDPCHLLHGQGVGEAPRRLLRQIPGLELVEHAHPDRCCGAAGTYNLTHPEMARIVLDDKLDALAAARPDIITSGNPGCLLQLRAGARRRGLPVQVLHPLELLAEVYP